MIEWLKKLNGCCSARCQMTLNHLKDKVDHDAGKGHLCRHQHQYDNLFYLCKVCYLTLPACRLYLQSTNQPGNSYHPRNDRLCVGWDVKPYSLSYSNNMHCCSLPSFFNLFWMDSSSVLRLLHITKTAKIKKVLALRQFAAKVIATFWFLLFQLCDAGRVVITLCFCIYLLKECMQTSSEELIQLLKLSVILFNLPVATSEMLVWISRTVSVYCAL